MAQESQETTSAITLKKAERKKAKLKLNLSAPSGAGKTMSALRMAFGLVGDWSKIAVIDTENESSSLYSHLGDFNIINLASPYTPERYIEAMGICHKAGMEVVIIDSSTHEWETIKEENQLLADAKFRGNTWAAWSRTTPRHDRFISAVLSSPFHVITCTRSKTESVMGDDKKVKKVGMKDMQREGWEYELTVSLEIDRDTHLATPSKDRTNLFENNPPFLITEETGELIKEWCETGKDSGPSQAELKHEKKVEYIERAVKIIKSSKTLEEFEANSAKVQKVKGVEKVKEATAATKKRLEADQAKPQAKKEESTEATETPKQEKKPEAKEETPEDKPEEVSKADAQALKKQQAVAKTLRAIQSVKTMEEYDALMAKIPPKLKELEEVSKAVAAKHGKLNPKK